MTLTLAIDVFFCGKARRAIATVPDLKDNLVHVYADEYQFKSTSKIACFLLQDLIDRTFEEAGIPEEEYQISIF